MPGSDVPTLHASEKLLTIFLHLAGLGFHHSPPIFCSMVPSHLALCFLDGAWHCKSLLLTLASTLIFDVCSMCVSSI
jgi:hypothetical protein